MKFNIKKGEVVGIVISGIMSIAFGLFSQISMNNTIYDLVNAEKQKEESTTEETEEEEQA